jgi:ribosomal protein L24E
VSSNSTNAAPSSSFTPSNRHQPKRARSSTSEYTLTQFQREFPDDAACLEHLWRTRHSPDGEHAYYPKCDSERLFRRYATTERRQSWTCSGCGHHVHPTAGTIFHKSSTSLHLWFCLDEYAWRYNHRREPRGMFFAILDNAARTGR